MMTSLGVKREEFFRNKFNFPKKENFKVKYEEATGLKILMLI